jgi:hypothetical protein
VHDEHCNSVIGGKLAITIPSGNNNSGLYILKNNTLVNLPARIIIETYISDDIFNGIRGYLEWWIKLLNMPS